MSLISPEFFVFVAITVVAFHLNASIAYRRLVLTAASLVFLLSYARDAASLVPLVAFLVLGYAGLQAIRARRNGMAFAIGIVAVLLAFVYLKRFSFTEPVVGTLPFPYVVIGLSYILFRVLHLMVDARSGDLPDGVGPFGYFRYTCNFLCFVSGPIQRYQDFAAMDGVQAQPLDAERVFLAFRRVVIGYAKFVVIAASANYAFTNLSLHLFGPEQMALPKLCALYVACAAAYTVYLYYNFSGYMDIVIGIGVLLGQDLPENFDRPFAARSFLEFWQRWHMTLSNWFKIYLFNPFLMLLMARVPRPSLTAYLGVVAFFVTFLVMGVWHGTTLVFVIYGLLMGAGASVNKLWQIACADRLGKKRYRALSQTTAYVAIARGVTVSYFAVALTCLWVPVLPQFVALARRLGVAGELGAFVLLALAFAMGSLAWDAAAVWIAARGERARSLSRGVVFRNLSMATMILAILAISSLFNKAPEFVYRAF